MAFEIEVEVPNGEPLNLIVQAENQKRTIWVIPESDALAFNESPYQLQEGGATSTN